jgi:hypothetical protein
MQEKGLYEKQVAEIKQQLKYALEHLNIQHATLETESEDCHDQDYDSNHN